MLQFLSEQVEVGDVIIMAVSGNAAVSFVDDGGSQVMKGLGVGSHERCPLNIGKLTLTIMVGGILFSLKMGRFTHGRRTALQSNIPYLALWNADFDTLSQNQHSKRQR